MPDTTLPGALGQGKSATTTGTGTALTTAPGTIMLPLRTRRIDLIPRNYSTAVAAQWTKVPWMTVLKTTTLLTTVAGLTDYSNAAQDNSTSTTLDISSLATIANNGALYIGAYQPFIGVVVDVQNTNSTASVLTVKYRKSDNTWATTSATDGTISAATTFAVDGNVTWTEPTDWIACRLVDVAVNPDPQIGHMLYESLFWTQWEVSVALDASTTLNSMVAIPRATYADISSGVIWSEQVSVGTNVGRGSICGISARTDAGTANLIINAYGGDGAYIPS